MKLQKALSFTGNEYQSMSYEELAEVTKAMAEAARRRISRVQEGPAYEKLEGRALGEGRRQQVAGLNVRNGVVRITQKFKGPNRMSMPELRTLRKELYNYLKDPRSTQSGLNAWREEIEEEERRRNTPVHIDEPTGQPLWDVYETLESIPDLMSFARNELGFDPSNDINTQIDYVYGTPEYERAVRDIIEQAIENIEGAREAPMPNFGF